MRKRAWLRDIRFVFGEVESLLLDGLLALDGAMDVFRDRSFRLGLDRSSGKRARLVGVLIGWQANWVVRLK